MKSFALLSLAALALAKTDYEGCTSATSTVSPEGRGPGDMYLTVLYYVPDTLEICQAVDCGGGRAPLRTVPGCPAYKGTETVPVSYLTADPAAPITYSRAATTTAATTTATEVVESEVIQTSSVESSVVATVTEVATLTSSVIPTPVVSKNETTTAAGVSSTIVPGGAPTAGAALGVVAGIAALAAFF